MDSQMTPLLKLLDIDIKTTVISRLKEIDYRLHYTRALENIKENRMKFQN